MTAILFKVPILLKIENDWENNTLLFIKFENDKFCLQNCQFVNSTKLNNNQQIYFNNPNFLNFNNSTIEEKDFIELLNIDFKFYNYLSDREKYVIQSCLIFFYNHINTKENINQNPLGPYYKHEFSYMVSHNNQLYEIELITKIVNFSNNFIISTLIIKSLENNSINNTSSSKKFFCGYLLDNIHYQERESINLINTNFSWKNEKFLNLLKSNFNSIVHNSNYDKIEDINNLII